MKIHIQIYFLAVCSMIMLTTISCSSSKKALQKDKTELSDKERIKLERLFHDANKAKILGEYSKASQRFSDCIRIDPTNDASMYELAYIYLQTRQVPSAKIFAGQAAKLKPDNKWYQLLYAETLGANGEYKEAAEVYEKLIEKCPDCYEYYYDWAYMLVKAKDLSQAIKTYEKLEDKVGLQENIIFRKQAIYLSEEKVDRAIAEIDRLIEAFPDKKQYYHLKGEIYKSTNQPEKAFNTYQYILSLDSLDSRAHLAMADYYLSKGDMAGYNLSLQKAFENPDMNIDKKIAILVGYITYFYPETENKEKQKEAYKLSDILLEVNPDEAKSYAIYGDFLFHEEKYEEARKMYLQSVEKDNNIFEVWKAIMRIDVLLEEYDSLIVHSNDAIELFPNQAVSYFFNGVSYNILKQYEKAIKSLEKAIMMGIDDGIKADIYSNMGDAYYNLKDNAKSDSCYELSLEINPDNEYVLNNYSYYLSLREENLPKAEEMSKKANELQPENISFQDTYGWIFYKLKKFDKALYWMDKSLKNGGDKKPVILEHYGDVLYRLGEIEKAVQYWKKAKENGSESELIDKKILDKKLYE